MKNENRFFSFIETVNRRIDSVANRKYNKRYNQKMYTKIVREVFGYDNGLANKLTDTCLALCGHSGYTVDSSLVRSLPDWAIAYLETFII